eukprot:CAMPEP_0197844702 /NCGR_PEP_ID=MMETSP1438-20131217/1682_1 /TAXON_ID=1461541 /ORGANISM="Pterosperma sp., Strain CCMP1384" /LENGTH=371 /DNA_ID=CAMNT_0043455639 /DNA_START=315 /DNA_END=1430 /DNA_ORIENTATION=+
MGVVAVALTLGIYLFTGAPARIQPLSPRLEHGLKVLVTGGAGFIGSHATLALLERGHAVTAVDNLSRGNIGAVSVLEKLAHRNQYRFINADLGDQDSVDRVFEQGQFDLVIHFAAVAYVGESVAEPLRYYSNITSNTVIIVKAMEKFQVPKLIYSSTCATYGNVETLPITEETPTVPVNPYGKAKLAAEQVVKDFAKSNPSFNAAILRYFNVYGSDPEGRLGEYPRPELRHHGRISGACYDAALGLSDHLTIMGTTFPTRDGTCVRDYIHVTDLVDAHLTVMKAVNNPPVLYNIGTGKGNSVREFVDTCLKVTGAPIQVIEQRDPRPGDYAEVYADTSKIKRELNWTAKYTNLEEGMRTAWNWRLKHKNGY